jgi:hypothetical protein
MLALLSTMKTEYVFKINRAFVYLGLLHIFSRIDGELPEFRYNGRVLLGPGM